MFLDSATSQQCLDPIPPFDVSRTYDPVSGYTHSIGTIVRKNHKISVDYYDNRTTVIDTFHTYGSATLENTQPEDARYVLYRQVVVIPNGEYEIEWTTFSSMTFNVCPFDGNYILSKRILRGGEFFDPIGTYQWDHYVHITPSTIAGDVNNDGCVNGTDIGLLLGAWGTDDPVMDINGNGIVDGADIGLIIAHWSIECDPGDECPYEETYPYPDPYTPHPIPGRIEAEDFDEGCEGYAFHDNTIENVGGEYRDTPVDVEIAYDDELGYNVGWIRDNEWMNYTVDVVTSGNYTFSLRVAKETPISETRILIDGVDVTGTIVIESTGGWHDYTDITTPPVYLEEGIRTLTLYTDDGDFNLNWIDVLSMP